MKLEDFQSGSYRRQFQFKSFSPVPVNWEWTWEEPEVNTLLERATRALSELNAYSLIVPDIDLFIQMHIIKEANTSSRIEGTRTEMDETLLEEEQIDPERRDDWREVQNYVAALNMAIEELETLPLSTRLLCRTHEILMRGVCGEHKTPGEYRRSQNWIGGSGLSDAVFIPPGHDEVAALTSIQNRSTNDRYPLDSMKSRKFLSCTASQSLDSSDLFANGLRAPHLHKLCPRRPLDDMGAGEIRAAP